MNNRFLTTATLIATSTFFVSGCSDDSPFETPPAEGDTPLNAGIVSQKNLSLLASDPQPKIFNDTGGAVDTELTMTVKIGDSKNQLLTDAHTVFFATEWGLIDPSCVTENGICTVTWQTSFAPDPSGGAGSTAPADHLVTIVAYTDGEESFVDANGNGKFDDLDTVFYDREEPFVDADLDGTFNAGDTLIDVINGNDTSGINGVHDIGDTFLNSPNCIHSSLCSTVKNTSSIWVDIEIDMDGPPAL